MATTLIQKQEEIQLEKLIKSLTLLYDQFPDVAHGTLDLLQILSNAPNYVQLAKNANEFSTEGRGDDYIQSIQLCPTVRAEGTLDLLKLLNPERNLSFSSDYVIADLLAGDGYIHDVVKQLLPADQQPFILNSDISPYMVDLCQKKGIFTVLQPAQDLFWLRSDSLDGVLYAYGSHHIPLSLRAVAAQEGARVLKPGGRWVLHDFEVNGPMDNWFGEVVNQYGKTRHDYPHFSQEEMGNLARHSGLRDIQIEYIEDPFVTHGSSETEALTLLAQYVVKMYGLIGLEGKIDQTLTLLDQYFKGVKVSQGSQGIYEARISRNALVCHGTK